MKVTSERSRMRCGAGPGRGEGQRGADIGRAGQVELAGDGEDMDPVVRVVIEPEAHRAILAARADPAPPWPPDAETPGEVRSPTPASRRARWCEPVTHRPRCSLAPRRCLRPPG